MKKLLILGTGGTIVSTAGCDGLAPEADSPALQALLDDMRSRYTLDYHGVMNLDSSNIQLEEWQTIAEAVYNSLAQYDGVVITHGTDTMAYTASILTFVLQNLKKPVVITGSQLPLGHPVSDAPANLALALACAAHGLPGVNIAFGGKIIKGCRAVKVRTMGFDAFESVNYPPLADFSRAGLEQWDSLPTTKAAPKPCEYKPALCNDVFLLKLIPGTNPRIFDSLLDLQYKGVVLEAFGVGGFHFLRRDLSDKIGVLVQKGVPVVVCSQCLYERSDFSVYEVGRKILAMGAIEGGNMTSEAATAKLMWALGQTGSLEEIRKIFATDYAGENTWR